MTRTHHLPTSRRALAGAVVVLGILALLPARWGRWVDGFGSIATTVVGPVKEPVSRLTRWFAGSTRVRDEGVVRQLEEDRDRFQALYFQQMDRAAELERQLQELRAGGTSAPGVRLLRARVIGPGSNPAAGMLEIRAGDRHGVERGTVATVGGAQLVGRIERVSGGTAWMALITAPATGKVDGVILVDEAGTRRIRCRNLYGQAGGTLRCYVEPPPTQPGEIIDTPKIGQLVRLDDPAWPPNAQMLVIGEVERIDHVLESPLRQVLTIRPTVRIDRVTEVTLRLSGREEGEP